jgi:hypothetical protein
MLLILNVNDFTYNVEYFSPYVLVSLIFKTPLIKERHEKKLGASELRGYHAD